MKTISAKSHEVQRQWYIIDAQDKTLGRMVSRVAGILRGKHKPIFTPHVDTGDYIVIINAGQVKVTGNNKPQNKLYYRHSGYPGGLKTQTFEKAMAENPVRVIETAVKGMLPKGPLGREMFRKLKVYAGAEHPHAAQQPQLLDTDQLT